MDMPLLSGLMHPLPAFWHGREMILSKCFLIMMLQGVSKMCLFNKMIPLLMEFHH